MEPSYMLWQDTDKKKSSEDKIAEGLEYYREKYAHRATICLCNPIDEVVSPFHGAKIETKLFIRPNKFWIGVATVEADLPDVRNNAPKIKDGVS